MSIQKWAADVLDAALNEEPEQPKDYVVRGYWWAPDAAEPGKTYVSVWRTLTEPAPNAQGSRRHELNVVVMTSHTDPAVADEALSDALDDVLDVLDHDEQLTGLAWTGATRIVHGDQEFPAMAVSTWCIGTANPEESP